MSSTPEPMDESIARELALAALREVTPESTIGAPAGSDVSEDGVVSLRFENRLAGYPGWYWTVSLAQVDDAPPSVLEVELLPGGDALLAPEWVPWAVRLAEYQAAQAAQAEASGDDEADAELEEVLVDVEDLDAEDFDTDGSPILHAGDVDGVDIDELVEGPDDEDDVDDADGVDDADDADDSEEDADADADV